MNQKLLRAVRNEKAAPTLFEVEPSWKDHWWAMPEFSMGDARPRYKITLNFMTAECCCILKGYRIASDNQI